jgi:hypothetical protein
MGILTNIIAAEEDESAAVCEAPEPLDAWSGIALHGIDVAKIVALHCLLTGDLFDDAAARYEPVYASAVEDALLFRLSDEAMERLVTIDEEVLDAVAAELAATEAFEIAGWEDEAIAEMLGLLVDLARLAESQGQVLFIRMHPQVG